MCGQPAGELGRRLGLAPDAQLERLQAAEQEPGGVGRGDRAGQPADVLEPLPVVLRAANQRPEEHVGMAAEVLRRAVQDEVGAVLERAKRTGVEAVASTRTRPGCAAAAASHVGKGQEGVRRRLEPDEVDAVRRRPGLVELDHVKAPARELPEQERRAVVAALREGDRLARLEQSASTTAVVAPAPEEKRSASPPSSSPSARSAATPVGCA